MLTYADVCSRLTYAHAQVVEGQDGAHLSADPFQPIPDAGALFGGGYESHAGGGSWGGVFARMLTYADVC